jgi:hypothetical protein
MAEYLIALERNGRIARRHLPAILANKTVTVSYLSGPTSNDAFEMIGGGPVVVEPVSTTEFPANREKNRVC